MVDWFSYAAALAGLKLMGLLPRSAARSLGASLAAAAFFLHPYFRRAALFNLQLAFPEWPDAKRRAAVRTMTEQVGWMVGEFSQFPKYDRAAIERIVVIDGLENFEAARNRGKGVLFLTGHMSAWELALFAQARYGNPLHFLAVRPLANARLDGLINGYRGLAGNQPIEKPLGSGDPAILRTLSDGGTVGILADHVTPRCWRKPCSSIFSASLPRPHQAWRDSAPPHRRGSRAGISCLGCEPRKIQARIRTCGRVVSYRR